MSARLLVEPSGHPALGFVRFSNLHADGSGPTPFVMFAVDAREYAAEILAAAAEAERRQFRARAWRQLHPAEVAAEREAAEARVRARWAELDAR